MHLQKIALNMVVKAPMAIIIKEPITTAIKDLKAALTQKNTVIIKNIEEKAPNSNIL
jgi:hypothetical protein